MSDECLFCRIVRREIPADIVFEDDRVLAFRDIQPRAPIHLLVIPKRHVASTDELRADHAEDVAAVVLAAAQVARDQGVDDTGYRLVMNCGKDGGQAVFHLHLHLLGGRPLAWPPG